MKLYKGIEKYLIDVQIRTSPENFEYEKSKCNMLNLFIGNKNIKRIDRDVINEYVLAHRGYNSDISNASLNKGIATLKRVVKYNTGIKIEYKKLKESKSLTPTIPKDTKEKIFKYLEDRKHRGSGSEGSGFRNLLFFRILDDTGLRLKEVRYIHIDNLNLSNNSYTATTTKTDLDRIVYYTDSTKELIIDYISKYDIKDFLFINMKSKKVVTTNSIENVAKRMRKNLGLKFSISPHKWRHTFANDFSKNTNDLESLRVMLGHTDISTTQRYLHHDDEHIKAQYMKSSDRRTTDNL